MKARIPALCLLLTLLSGSAASGQADGGNAATLPSLPPAQALAGIEESARKIARAATQFQAECQQHQMQRMANPYYFYDPSIADPMMSNGYDQSLDNSPVLSQDTGRLIPPRPEKLASYLDEMRSALAAMQSDTARIALPNPMPGESKVQWMILTDAVTRLQGHVRQLQTDVDNNVDNNDLLADSARKVWDPAEGALGLARHLSGILKHER